MDVRRTETLLLAVVDDDPIYREYVSHLLSSTDGIQALQAASSDELFALLSEHAIDCIILDYNLGGETGLAVGELIAARYADPPPIVMLTGEGGERTAVKAFRSGFSDYVSKRNLAARELMTAIRRAVDRRSTERQRTAEFERLSRLADLDRLTGLYGRSYLEQRFTDLVASARRRRGTLALLVIKLLELDSIHDRFGQAMGDRALRAFAARLQKVARRSDICGRLDGSEFLYLADRDVDARVVGALGERLASDLSFEANFETISLNLKAAVGAALYPTDGLTEEQLLAAARQAIVNSSAARTGFAAASQSAPPPDDPPATPAGAERNALVAVETTATVPDATLVGRQSDRRGDRRQRVLKRGQILMKERYSAIDCTIRDVSTTGARIRVDDYFAAPEEFELLFLSTGARQLVRTRWQVGNDIGVQFVG